MHVSLGGEIGILTARATAAGLVYTGPCLIYWVTLIQDDAGDTVEISDGIVAGTTKWIGEAKHCNFGKPMEMATGIYVESLDHSSTCTIGYAVLPS